MGTDIFEKYKKLQEKFQREMSVNPSDITVTSIDEQLLQRAINTVENNISNPDFDTTMMAREVGLSRALLHTKLKALTGQSTGEFIRSLRLKRAAQLFQKGYGNVTQVAYDVGFQNLSYFASRSDYSKEEILSYIESTVKNNKDIYGSTIAFEPYGFEDNRYYFAPYFYKGNNKINFSYLGSNSYDYFTWDWYKLPKAANEPLWSDPYYDKGGGEIRCTGSHGNKGRFVLGNNCDDNF